MGLLRRERGQRTGSKHESMNKGRNLRMQAENMNAARPESRPGQQWPLSFQLHVDSARLLGSRLVVPIVRENGILSVPSSDGRIWRFGVPTEQLETDNNSSSAVWKWLGPSPVRRKKGKCERETQISQED